MRGLLNDSKRSKCESAIWTEDRGTFEDGSTFERLMVARDEREMPVSCNRTASLVEPFGTVEMD